MPQIQTGGIEIVTTVGALDIWQETIGTGEQEAELERAEDQNMETGVMRRGGGLKKIDTII